MYAWLLVVTLFAVGALLACTCLLRADQAGSFGGGVLAFALALALVLWLAS